MAVIINASTSTGLVQSADTSGIIQFQSNGSTKATLNSSGFSYPGAVLQVVSGTYDSTYSSNSTSFADLISLSITPASASNKILISVFIYAAGYGAPKVLRNSTAIVSPNVNYALYYASPNSTQPYQSGYRFMYPFQVYDSPATTSAITYKLQIQAHDTSSYIVINPDTSNNYSTTSPAQSLTRMTIMEISV